MYCVDGIFLNVCLLIWAAAASQSWQTCLFCCMLSATAIQAIACRHSGQSLAYWRPQHRAAEVTLERGHMMQRVGEHWAQPQSHFREHVQLNLLDPLSDCACYRVPC